MSDDNDPLNTIAGGGGVIFGGRIVKLGLLFLIEIFMARVLGATGYGSVVLATIAIVVGTRIANLGVPRGLSRKLPYYEDTPPKARGVLRAGVAFTFLGGALAGAIVFLMAPYLANGVFDNPKLAPLFRIAAVGIPFSVTTVFGLSTAKSGRTAKPRVIVNHFVNPIAQTVFIGMFVLAGFRVSGAVAGRVLAKFVAATVALYLAYRSLRFVLRGPTVPMYRELFLFSIPLMFASGVDFLIANTDTFLVGAFLTSSAVGIYNVAFQLRTAGLFFYHPLTYLLPPVLSKMDANDDLEEAHRVYQVVTKWITFITTPVFLAVVFFPRIAILLSFGSQYVEGALPLRILAFPIMVTTFLGANEKALIALGYNRISLYVNLVVATLNIALNVILIPQTGIVGAALASGVAFIFRDLTFTVALYRWEGVHPFSRSMVRPFFGGITLALLGYPLLVKTVGISVGTVVAAGLLYLAVYAPLSVLLGAIEPEDRLMLELVERHLDKEIPYIRRIVSTVRKYGL